MGKKLNLGNPLSVLRIEGLSPTQRWGPRGGFEITSEGYPVSPEFSNKKLISILGMRTGRV